MFRENAQNVGRRRYPHYWLSPTYTVVRPIKEKVDVEQPSAPSASEKQPSGKTRRFTNEDDAEEAALEGRANFFPNIAGGGGGRESASGTVPPTDDLQAQTARR